MSAFLVARYILYLCLLVTSFSSSYTEDIVGCGGFVKSDVEINFELIKVKLYTKQGILKYESDCAPANGYYMVPVYDQGEYLLKVESPLGWTFEPDVVELNIDWKNDKCSLEEDINFLFTGFGIAGKVTSVGQNTGPKGVVLTLKKLNSEEEIATTMTTEDGVFTFEKIIPGRYDIKASHLVWNFQKSEATVTVDKQTGRMDSEIVVAGFDLTGKILSDRQPVQGVQFLIYSSSVHQEIVKHCNNTLSKDFPTLDNANFICFVTSTKSGEFSFAALPTGEYTLVPFYKNERIKYEVAPAQKTLVIQQDSVLIKEPFQVSGFLVSGKVLSSLKGEGLEGVSVLVNGIVASTSSLDGTFHLDGMRAGKYKVVCQKENYLFEELSIKISPSDPIIPDIYATKYQVCGSIVLDQMPDNTATALKFVVSFETSDGNKYSTVFAKADGTFCQLLQSNSYIIKVETESKDSRIYLLPSARNILVKDKPILDIVFTQLQAKVSGSIKCIDSCGSVKLFLKSLDDLNDEGKYIQLSSNEKIIHFTQDVFMGSYQVSIVESNWCWVKESVQVEIKNEDVNNVDFQQNGFKMNIVISHNAQLEIIDELTNKSELFTAVKGSNFFCLPLLGKYIIQPQVCHKFEQESYEYDLKSDKSLMMKVISYLVKFIITSNEGNAKISASIQNLADTTQLEEVIDSFQMVEKSMLVAANASIYRYEATFYTKETSRLGIKMHSDTLLFEPDVQEIEILTDSCPAATVSSKGLKGVFIEGHVEPPTQDVEILFQYLNSDRQIMATTDARGVYKIGPLSQNVEYSLSAKKLGFRLVEDAKNKHMFTAFKLAEIIVQVTNDDVKEEKLSDVLISLSGSKFRRNNLTLADGTITFMDLAPGQYFLKPMMKEFEFVPSTKVIDISEGQVLKIDIVSKRVAYSAYCLVTSLNGEPEVGLVVEAIGSGPTSFCNQLQEEAKTEADGRVRLRGLKPTCDYIIQLKNDSEYFTYYERSSHKHITIIDKDISNIHFIVFRRSTQMDLSGRINSKQEYLDTIKVKLFTDANPDEAIQTQVISTSPFFFFNSLFIDKQGYTMKLYSSLSHRDFEYSLPEIHFKADSAIQHFVFSFNPQRKASGEHELSQASILVLPFTIATLFICYNYKMVIPFLQKQVSQHLVPVFKTSPTSHAPQTPPRQNTPELNSPVDPLDPLAKKRKKITKI